MDDSTPYMSIIPVSYESITLSDFKKVFNRRGYNYFCKEYDVDLKRYLIVVTFCNYFVKFNFREVKVEITSDLQKLHKSANGLIELFLLSQSSSLAPVGNGGLSSGTLPRIKEKPSSSTTDFTALGYKVSLIFIFLFK